MDEPEVIRLMRNYLEGLFPKICPSCSRCFETLREYIAVTQPLGGMVSYDAELEDWEPQTPIGAFAYANCTCGSTLAVDTEGLPLSRRLVLLQWIKAESEKRGVSPADFLYHLRRETRKLVLTEPSG